MKNKIKIIFGIIALTVLAPSLVFADGGGPLLLIFNFLAFLYGSILIILVEWFLYVRLASVPRDLAFFDALVANILSTLVVGFGFPLVIGFIGYLGSVVSPEVGEVTMALGTWVYENMKYPKLSFSMTALWLIVTYFLTVKYEAKIIRNRWCGREFSGKISPEKLSWYCNSITYAGLFIFFLVAWVFEKNHI